MTLPRPLKQSRRLVAVVLMALLWSSGRGAVTVSGQPPSDAVTSSLATTPAGSPAPVPTTPHPRRPRDNDIKFERISLRQGLSQSVVTNILQDSRGFMWFGTQDGLNRFDGYDFVVYRGDPEDPQSLSDGFVQAIVEDPSGVLWLGTNNGGLDRFDRRAEEFIRFQHDPSDPQSLSNNDVTAICQDEDGVLWLGTNGGGLNRFDPQTQQFTRYQNDPGNPHSLSNNAVAVVYEDHSGVLWVGTLGGGLCRFDPATGEFVTYQNNPDDHRSLGNNFVQAILEDSTGALWIGTFAGGLNRLDRQSGQFTHFLNDPQEPHSLSDNNVQIIFEDRRGELWVGTAVGGLNRFQRDTGGFVHYRHNPTDAQSLSDNDVLTISESQDGVLWIGTVGGGLSKADRMMEQFTHYRHDPGDPDSLSSDGLWGICEDREGILWLGTNGGGLNRLDPQTGSFAAYRNDPEDPATLSSDIVYSAGEDSSGTLWVGTSAGLDRLDRITGQFKRYPTFSITTILEDQQGALWAGTLGGGLASFDRHSEQFSFYVNDPEDPNSISDNGIVQVYEDREGLLWIATFNGGLECFDRETEQFIHHAHNPDDPQSVSSNTILAVYEDSDNRLWVATTAGLDRLDREKGSFTHYRAENGLPSNLVYAILEDDQGFLWVSTNGGLSRVDPQTGSVRNYTELDGLQSNEFNMSAYCKSRRGELFFGGINGLNAFYPDAIQDDPHVPPVVITEFQLFNQPVPVGGDSPLQRPIAETDEIRLSYRDSFFSFAFAALNYAAPEQNGYAYVMEGLDKGWNNVGNRRLAVYTSVPPGNYTFRVKASNSDGVWNEQGASLRVVVVPPFWQTLWFRGSLLLLSILAAVAVFKLRVRGIEAQRRQLEIQVNERTKELRETLVELERAKDAAEAASRAKSVFLANMSHEFRTPLNAILGFTQLMLRSPRATPEQKEDLEIVNRSGEHLLGLINDVLQLSKIEAGRTTLNAQTFDLHRMLEGLVEMFGLRAGQKGLSLDFDVSPEVPRFVRLDEGKLRQVLMNLLGNAVKFTQEGGVSLRVLARPAPQSGTTDQVLHLEVEDSGPGIALEELASLFAPFVQTKSGQQAQEGTGLGLTISQQFVQLMGGHISVKSEVGKGSIFEFDLPVEVAAQAYVPAAESVRRVIGLAPDQPVHRLLVVDDKEANRKLLVKMLAPLGLDVREAANGQEAVDSWEKWDPHLIFMDMRMPVMDGYEATRRIKGTTRGQATIIVALTASALEEDREVILSEGCDDYMRKPFREADLLRTLEEHLGVQFAYEEQPAGEQAAAGEHRGEGITLQDGRPLSVALASMPPGWLEELQGATILGNLEAIIAAVERIRTRDAALAETLESLANTYAHEAILGSITAVGGRHDQSGQ